MYFLKLVPKRKDAYITGAVHLPRMKNKLDFENYLFETVLKN